MRRRPHGRGGQCFAACLAAIAALASGLPAARAARPVPQLTRRVIDMAGLMRPGRQNELEAQLRTYQLRTGRQFCVLVVSDLDGEDIETYAGRVADAWKLGRKPQDDGLLLLIAVQERRARVQVGYGLEGDITDLLSYRVIHDVLRPALRRRDAAGGIDQVMQVLMQAADKSPVEGLLPQEPGDGALANQGAILALIVLVFLLGPRFVLPMLMVLGEGGGRRGRGDSGGGFSGGGGRFGGGGASGDW